ncbi:MAG: NapC/NirT family cytochrome c [Chloroflexi bacterium]|nr:NapC/NirT family cytochrome c [Chloroflexota bacterium]
MRTRRSMRDLNWRTLIIVGAGVVEMFLLTLGGIKMLEFTDSSQFCGQICHTPMTPEFKTFTVSPHSRVECATCHVGSGASYFVKSKVSGVPLIVATAFDTYPRPIQTPVENLRPARDTCQECHWPQKFSEDRLKRYVRFANDEKSTRDEFQLAFRVGSGEASTARDIHWHIASELWYLPLDEKNQNIAWVGVKKPDGGLTEYFDLQRTDQVTPERIASEKRFMDCLDCHNRATHIFRSPDQLVDEAMARGRIDAGLPFIKRLAVEALDVANPSLSVTQSKISAIDDFYKNQYAQVYADKRAQIEAAQAEISSMVQYVVFPDMRVTWQTHTNNLTHQGCFRCHGKLTSKPSDPDSGRVDFGCETCHYSVSGTRVSTPKIPHATEGRADCLACHGTTGAIQVPTDHSGRTNDSCQKCHVRGNAAPTPPSPTTPAPTLPAPTAPAPTPPAPTIPTPAPPAQTAPTVPSIPHSLEGRSDCLMCHAAGSVKPFPAGHAGRTSQSCQACHKPA